LKLTNVPLLIADERIGPLSESIPASQGDQ